MRIINNPMHIFSTNSGVLIKNIFDTLCDNVYDIVYICVCVCVSFFPHLMFIALIRFSLKVGVSSFSEANSLTTLLLIRADAIVGLFLWPLFILRKNFLSQSTRCKAYYVWFSAYISFLCAYNHNYH